MTPEQIEQTRERLRGEVRNIWRWQQIVGGHSCSDPVPATKANRYDARSCVQRGRCEVSEERDDAIDALVRFERAEVAERWGWMYCRDAAVYDDARAELDRIIRETLGTEGA